MPEAVIVATARSPIGRAFKGSLVSLRPDDMAAQMVKAVLAKVPELEPAMVEDLLLGNAQPAGEAGYNMARVVALLAGLPSVPGTTVNRYCSSSLQTIRMAAHAIRAGEGDVFIAAGVEAVSRFGQGMADGMPDTHNASSRRPRTAAPTRALGGSGPWTPPTGLPDIYIAMGQTAENVRELEGVSRRGHGPLRRPIPAAGGGLPGERVFRTGDQPARPRRRHRGSDRRRPPAGHHGREVLAELKPAFRPDGEITAGNSCPLNDGAAAVIVMSDTQARDLGITPLARIVSSGVTALDPEIMGLGPIEACRQALGRASMTIDDIDLVEINEAFAAQVVPSARHLGIEMERLNVHGGAIALGHPFGMTGARIMTTLINGLQTEDKTIGLESMCVGGGQGMAMVIERLSLIIAAVISLQLAAFRAVPGRPDGKRPASARRYVEELPEAKCLISAGAAGLRSEPVVTTCTWNFRRHARWVLTVACLVVAVSGVAVPRASADQISDLQAQAKALAARIQNLGLQEEAFSEQYDSDVLNVQTLEGKVAQAGRQLAQTSAHEARSKGVLKADAVQAYVHGGANPLTSSNNPLSSDTNGLLRAEYVNSLATDESDAIDQYHLAALQDEAAKTQLQQETAAAQTAVRQVSRLVRPCLRSRPSSRARSIRTRAVSPCWWPNSKRRRRRRPRPQNGPVWPPPRPPSRPRQAAQQAQAAAAAQQAQAAAANAGQRGRHRTGRAQQRARRRRQRLLRPRGARRRPSPARLERWPRRRAGWGTPMCGVRPGRLRSTVPAW